MIYLRKNLDRGYADHGWLKSYHTFSFADYYDPNFMGFGVLRVINEDWIQGGSGFPAHPHKEMEIVTYVFSGTLEHQDSLGNKAQITHGEIQRMSAGKGIRHSEYNPSIQSPCELLQIWLTPKVSGIESGYEQVDLKEKFKFSEWVNIVSPSGEGGSVSINQDVFIYAGNFTVDQEFLLPLDPSKKAWLQMVAGELILRDQVLLRGDALAIDQEKPFRVTVKHGTHFLFFILP